MLHTLEAVRENLRNRDGKRVFYLGKGDSLTSGARDFLLRELDGYIASLTEYRDAMAENDYGTLVRLLDEGRKRKEEVDGR